jgi:hypothetical protein
VEGKLSNSKMKHSSLIKETLYPLKMNPFSLGRRKILSKMNPFSLDRRKIISTEDFIFFSW